MFSYNHFTTSLTCPFLGFRCLIIQAGMNQIGYGELAVSISEAGEAASISVRLESSVEDGVLPAGQSAATFHQVKPVTETVTDIVAEAREA